MDPETEKQNIVKRDGFEHHFESFLVTLETLSVIFEGIGSMPGFQKFFRDSLGDPRLRGYTQWVVTYLFSWAVNK